MEKAAKTALRHQFEMQASHGFVLNIAIISGFIDL
jgi:hypothetical protein